MPVDGAGRVEVIASLLHGATAAWSAPDGWTEDGKIGLIDAFGLSAFDAPAGKDSRTLSMRPVAETLLAGILDASVPTLRRAHDLIIGAARPGRDPATVHRQAARVFREPGRPRDPLPVHPTRQRAGGDAQPPGRTLAGLFADLLTSAAGDAPLTLDFEALRTALERPYRNDPAATRYAGLVLSLRDQLRLMSATGVIGPIRYVADRVPHDDNTPGWTFEDGRWTTRRDMLAKWPTAVADPVTAEVEILPRDDLRETWQDFVAELDSWSYEDADDAAAALRLTDWADDLGDELHALSAKPAADRSAAMGAAAWTRRLAQARALRDEIHAMDVGTEISGFANQLVEVTKAAERLAATPTRQAAFGRGTLPAIDEAAPLPLLRRIAPGVSQRLDRAAGVVHLREGATTVTWRLPAAPTTSVTSVTSATPAIDVARTWQQDEALRELDVFVAVRHFSPAGPLSLDGLPPSLSYDGSDLRSGTGDLLARRQAIDPVRPPPTRTALPSPNDTGAEGDISIVESTPSPDVIRVARRRPAPRERPTVDSPSGSSRDTAIDVDAGAGRTSRAVRRPGPAPMGPLRDGCADRGVAQQAVAGGRQGAGMERHQRGRPLPQLQKVAAAAKDLGLEGAPRLFSGGMRSRPPPAACLSWTRACVGSPSRGDARGPGRGTTPSRCWMPSTTRAARRPPRDPAPACGPGCCSIVIDAARHRTALRIDVDRLRRWHDEGGHLGQQIAAQVADLGPVFREPRAAASSATCSACRPRPAPAQRGVAGAMEGDRQVSEQPLA